MAELRRQTRATSQVEVAQRIRMSRTFICDVLQGRRGVTASLARALGFEREVLYRQAQKGK